MSAEAGTPRHLFPADLARNWPDWSADVRSISYSVEHGVGGSSTTDGRFLAAVSEDMPVVKVLDLRTRHCSEVARRRGISFPVWSADSILYFQDLLTPRAVYRFRPGDARPQRTYSFEDLLHAATIRCDLPFPEWDIALVVAGAIASTNSPRWTNGW